MGNILKWALIKKIKLFLQTIYFCLILTVYKGLIYINFYTHIYILIIYI